MLSATTPMFGAQAVAKGVSKAVSKVAKATEKAAPKGPWLKNTLSSWKSYLAETPKADYLPRKKGEGMSLHFSHSWAQDAFGTDGSSVDPSALAFGKNHFSVRDMFAASDLIANEEVRVVKAVGQSAEIANNSRHFLYLLANQELSFDAHYSKQEITLSYDRLFLGKKLAVHFDFPLVRKEHSMVFDKQYEITKSNRAALVEVTSLNSPLFRSVMGDMSTMDAPAFYESYNDMQTLISNTLAQSGLNIKKTQEVFGIGDITLGVTYNNKLKYVDDASFGAQLSLGTGTVRRNIALWEPATSEKSGATTLSLNASLGWNRGRYANPFFKASLGYTLPVGVARRIPFMLRHDGEHNRGARMMEVQPRTVPFSELMTLSGVSFEQPENKIREVASTVQKATLHQGLDLNIRLGNLCENCFNRPIFFSLAYDLKMHQGNRYSGFDKDQKFAMDVMEENTYGIVSTLMSTVGYRLNSDCFVDGALEYRFGGRNELATATCRGGIAFRF